LSVISRTAEYALRAVIWLAYHADQPQTTQQIAVGTAVPAGYLSKVLQALGRAGVVHSQRGLHGGFLLQSGPDKLTVLEVVNAVAPLHRMVRCPLDLDEHRHSLCRLHELINRAMGRIEEVFGGATINDLIAGDPCARPLGDGSRVMSR
jgi:Rrf2 family nitric oxide-sensitive transcriptional repressor